MIYPNQLRDAFQAIQQSSLMQFYEMKSFGYGDSARIVAFLRSSVEYPLLWLEYIDYETKNNSGNFFHDLSCAFSVVTNCTKDDTEAQDNALDLNMQKAEWVLAQLYAQGIIHTNDSASFEPLDTYYADNVYGYRVTFKIRNINTSILCS